jgi:MFS superfamily sulfate permease-like transporter
MIQRQPYFSTFFTKDLIASLIGFLVAIPMSLGIAIASGAPAAYGVIGGIIGCLGIGLLTTAPLMITGPAAGLVAITFATVNHVGIEKLGVVVLLAGLIQILTGIFKIGQLFRAITPSVIHGMMSGIGMIIILSQFHILFDVKPTGSALQNMMNIPSTMQTVLANPNNLHAGYIGGLAIVILWTFRFLPRFLKKLPSSFYAIVGGSLAAISLNFTAIKHIALPHSLLDSIHLVNPADFSMVLDSQVLLAAIAMAFIASSKALLTASATESMHDADRTQNNKEVIVQGAGNIVSGLVGGIPLSGEILRSTVNIHSGARTRYSLVMIGAWLLLFVGLFPQFLEYIPVSCLAGLLVYTGFQLLGMNQVKELAHFGKMEVAIFTITALAVTFIDPLDGVIIGMFLGLVSLCLKLSSLVIEMDDELIENMQYVKLQGKGTFVNVPKLASTLEKLHPGQKVHVDIESLEFVDNAFYDFLQSWHKGYNITGGEISLGWDKLDGLLSQHKTEASIEAESTHLAEELISPQPTTLAFKG